MENASLGTISAAISLDISAFEKNISSFKSCVAGMCSSLVTVNNLCAGLQQNITSVGVSIHETASDINDLANSGNTVSIALANASKEVSRLAVSGKYIQELSSGISNLGPSSNAGISMVS
jgi:hypothetical protein